MELWLTDCNVVMSYTVEEEDDRGDVQKSAFMMWKGEKGTELIQFLKKDYAYDGDTTFFLIKGRFKKGKWVGLRTQFRIRINKQDQLIRWH